MRWSTDRSSQRDRSMRMLRVRSSSKCSSSVWVRARSMATSLISSSSAVERAVRFADPTLAKRPSIVMILACSIVGWNRPNAYGGVEECGVGRLGGELDEARVGVRPGHEDIDFDPARRCVAEAVDDLGVGDEVGGSDADALSGKLAQRANECVEVAVADLGGTAHTLHD